MAAWLTITTSSSFEPYYAEVDGKAHDLDNLYVVDGSFFPANGGVNPALTIIAKALRVGDRLLTRL